MSPRSFHKQWILFFADFYKACIYTCHRLGLRRISTPSFYNETLRCTCPDRSIFAVAKLITFMGLKMDGLDLPGSLTISQPTELLQQP
ncbi:unnamed protein product [Brassica rapa subsp. trilocularis]